MERNYRDIRACVSGVVGPSLAAQGRSFAATPTARRSTTRGGSRRPRRKRTSSGLDGLLIGVEDVDAVDVERNIGCARLGRAIHAARCPALLRLSRP